MTNPTMLPSAPKQESERSKLDRLLDITTRYLTSWIGKFTAYLAAATAALVAFDKFTAQVAAPSKWTAPAVIVTVFFIVALLEGVPAIRAERRKQKLQEVYSKDLVPGYFHLGPRCASEAIVWPDKKHEEILIWLKETKEPVLYLTGKSGCGKSSLLDAWIIPQLETGSTKHLILKMRAYQDPVEALQEELRRPKVVWQRRPAEKATCLELLARACQQISPRRLLIIFDQFEEFIILSNPEQSKRFTDLLAALQASSALGLTILVIIRSDYIGRLEDLKVPKLLQGRNWKELAPFLESHAYRFIQDSQIQIKPDLLQAVLREASDFEQTPGLIRPIAVNLCGLVIARCGGKLPLGFRPGQLLRGFLRETLSVREIRDISPCIVSKMITPNLTKQPRSISFLAKSCNTTEKTVRLCLRTLGLPERGIVRPLDSQQETWEISHDFLVPLLESIAARWSASFSRAFFRWLPWIFAAIMGVLAFTVFLAWRDPAHYSIGERRLVDLNNRLAVIKDSYETIPEAPVKGPSVNKNARQLVEQLLTVDDEQLGPGMRIYKYRLIAHAWVLIAGTEPDSTARIGASEKILDSCNKAQLSITEAQQPINWKDKRKGFLDWIIPGRWSKKKQSLLDWIITDDAVPHIKRLSAIAYCVRWDAAQNQDDRLKVRQIVESIPYDYRNSQQLERSRELQPCLANQ